MKTTTPKKKYGKYNSQFAEQLKQEREIRDNNKRAQDIINLNASLKKYR